MTIKHNRWLGVVLASSLIITACDSSTPESQGEQSNQTQQSDQTITAKANSKQQKYSAEQFFQTKSFFGSSINHDSSAVLVTSDIDGIFNVYRYPINGDKPTQLTKSTTNANNGVSWFPNDDRVLFTADNGGDELNHIFVREIDGSIKDLTPGQNLKAMFMGWQKDSDFFFIASNERDAKAFDLYKYSTKDYKRELVFKNGSALGLGDISINGRWLSMAKSNTNKDSDIFLIDLNSDEKLLEKITEHKGDVAHSIYGFAPDSSSLIYSTDEFGEFNQAWRYDLSNKQKVRVAAADWDISFVYYSDKGTYQIVGMNQDAQTTLTITNTKTGEIIDLPDLPAGDLRGVNFSNDEKQMVFYINSDTSPSNLYSYTLGAAEATRLTNALNPDIDESRLVASSVDRFKSFDGLEVPGLLFKPKMASADNKVPAVILIHGGPGGQSRKGYSAMRQHLVNHGYAVFAVNNRGSSGYGKTFFHLDDKKHGEDDLQDIVYGKKYLQTLDWIDGEKIGVMGGSYGGYLTMAAMAFTKEFEVGVDIFGVTNWERTLTSIPPWWEAFKKSLYDEMGDPAADGERHRRISPLFHAEGISKPVLIVQGANDPRVLQVESDEMVAAIRKNNVPVDYLLFEDEGHGFRKKQNRIAASDAYVKFLDTYLKK
ncbi:MAG: S9 family peptidase [Kangiellaceae bacterium]|jgi:prolyl oligopeptidase|nr:S9 family peptidase [Kangiellaceae bacterium]